MDSHEYDRVREQGERIQEAAEAMLYLVSGGQYERDLLLAIREAWLRERTEHGFVCACSGECDSDDCGCKALDAYDEAMK